MDITDEILRQVMPNAPRAKRAAYLPHVNAAMREFGIGNELRAAAFLAQLAHESGELRYMEELASGSAYEGRKDLGNTQPGDGKRFKGRGPIQLTGRSNYRRYGELLLLPLEQNPALAASPEVGFRVAAQFWALNDLNELADRRQFKAITKRVNGGYNGLKDRVKFYERALAAIPDDFGGEAQTDEEHPDTEDADSQKQADEEVVVVEQQKPAPPVAPTPTPGISASKIGAGLASAGGAGTVLSAIIGAGKWIVVGLLVTALLCGLVWLVGRYWFANKTQRREAMQREAEAKRAHEITMAKIAAAQDKNALTVEVTS